MTPNLDLSGWGALTTSVLFVIVCPAFIDYLTEADASNMLKSKVAWWAAWLFSIPAAVAAQADMFAYDTPADVAAWVSTTLAAALVSAATIRGAVEIAHASTKYSRVRKWLAGQFGGLFGDNLADLERWAQFDPLGFEQVAALTPAERADLAKLANHPRPPPSGPSPAATEIPPL